jgi:formamidopyrimidine-DNA glycosylase
MPELPEVETMVRDLQERVVGRTITNAQVYWDRMVLYPDVPGFKARLTGRRVEAVRRRGKFAIFDLDDGGMLGVHRGMTGSLLHRSLDSEDDRFVRARFQLDDGYELRMDDARKFGKLVVIAPDVDEVAAPWEGYGPEPLAADLDPAEFRARFAGRRAAIKTLLLNQRVLAGVGNIYADESLFLAGIRPTRPANSLSKPAMKRLLEAIRTVLTESIEARGTTFSTYRDVDGEMGRNQSTLRVFGKQGQSCPRCGGEIRKIVLNARGTHFCPRCQK